MGATYIEGVVTGSAGKKVPVRFLVDSGASFALLPEKARKQIGLKPKRNEVFALADGTTVERQVSEATSCCRKVRRTPRLS